MCDAATNRRSFRAQLAGVLEKLTKVAVLEIGALAEECSLVLHTEISQRKSENEALKKKCFYLEVQLKAATTTTRGSSSAQHYPPVNTAAGRRQQSQSHGHGGAILHVPEKLVCREPQQPDPAIEGVFGKDWCMDLWRGEKPDPPQSKERVGCSNIADVVVPQAIDLMDGEPDLIFVKEESYEDQPIAQETRHTDNRKSGGGGGGGFEGSSSQRGVNELQLYPGELNNFPIMTTAGQSQQGGVQPTLMDKLIEDSTLGTLVDDANPPSSATGGEYSEYANDIHGNPAAKDLASQRAGKAAPKQFECLFCGKVFNYLSSLKVHIRRHSGEKPFSCTVCGKRFAQKTYLKLHQRVHSGEKPYTCQQCGKRFSQKSSLNIHLRTHTGEKPYSCVDCGKSYAYKYGFNQHQCFN